MSRPAMAPWARELLRRLRAPLVLLLAYLLLHLLLAAFVTDGLFFPSVAGQGLWGAALTLLLLVLRLATLALLPLLLVRTLVLALWRWLHTRARRT